MSVKITGRKVVFRVPKGPSQEEVESDEIIPEQIIDETQPEEINIPKKIIELIIEDQKPMDETQVKSLLEIQKTENVQEISITSKGREKTFAQLESEQIEVEKKPEQEFIDIDDTIEMVTKNITGRKILFRVPRRSSQQEIETLELEEKVDEKVQRKDSITVQSDETVLIKKRIPGEIVTFNVPEIPIRKKSIPDEQSIEIDKSVHVTNVRITGRKVVFRVPKRPSQEIVETDEIIPEKIIDETQLEEIIIPTKTIQLITEDQKPIDETDKKSVLEIEQYDENVQEISITSKGREKTSTQLESERIEVEKLPEHEFLEVEDSNERVDIKVTGRKVVFRVPRKSSQPEIETFELSPEKALIPEISSDEIKRETSDELDIDKKDIDQKTEATEENVKPIQEIRIKTKGSKKTKTKLESTELEMEKDQFKFVDITEDIDEKELEVQATIELKKPKDKDQPFSSEIEMEKTSELKICHKM
ncbi:uncharacterized protein LOC128388064 [Panonychus citri]|uniref:uncharacterized protein LOC128388064 n=1 Tax=Panonychus citri TaxID=50023 RepID=UPI002307CA2A|nr:uncharacterized protein LOC128388064 [Panonychus citri]